MTYSDAIIKRLSDLCADRGITINRLATLSGITQYISSPDCQTGQLSGKSE